jgi:hypothetical protein
MQASLPRYVIRLLFGRAYLEHGAVVWPGEIDLVPDAMYDESKDTADGFLNKGHDPFAPSNRRRCKEAPSSEEDSGCLSWSDCSQLTMYSINESGSAISGLETAHFPVRPVSRTVRSK